MRAARRRWAGGRASKAHTSQARLEKQKTFKNKETYGFKSKFTQKQPEELKNFENEMFDQINQVKFRKLKDKFQHDLKKDARLDCTANTKEKVPHPSNNFEAKAMDSPLA